MVSFVDFSTNDSPVYLVMDEDVFYKWHVTNEHVDNVKNWLRDRKTYKFKLELNGGDMYIKVYRENDLLLRAEIKEVTFL